MRGTSLRLENTLLHREDFVRVDKLHAPSAEHDAHGAVFLRGEVDCVLDRRVLDAVPADPVVQSDLPEDLWMFSRPLRLRVDLERSERTIDELRSEPAKLLFDLPIGWPCDRESLSTPR